MTRTATQPRRTATGFALAAFAVLSLTGCAASTGGTEEKTAGIDYGPDESLDPALVSAVTGMLSLDLDNADRAMKSVNGDYPATLAEFELAVGIIAYPLAGTTIEYALSAGGYCLRAYNPASDYRGQGAYLFRAEGSGVGDLPTGDCEGNPETTFVLESEEPVPTDAAAAQARFKTRAEWYSQLADDLRNYRNYGY